MKTTNMRDVTSLRSAASSVRRRASWFVRDHLPEREVVREVQGVRMAMPWSHRLPDYTGPGSVYGQNLVDLARALDAVAAPVTVIDVGANIGDSTLQILDAVDGRVLCVEADDAYLAYLHRNVDGDPRVAVVEALLVTDPAASGATAVRSGGTTRFTEGEVADAAPTITPAALRAGHPDFADLRLIKSDTDGFDVKLVPALAREWAASTPVLFFEYDPYLIRIAGFDPLDVWRELAELGYRDTAVWTHDGLPVRRTTTEEIGAQIGVLDEFNHRRPGSRSYWDVAVVHQSDERGLAALESLMPATTT